jgi:hypothetical protein
MPKANVRKIMDSLKAQQVAPYTRRQLDELIRMYRQAEREIQKALLSSDLSDVSRIRSKQIETSIKMILMALNNETREWGERVISVSYGRGVDVAAAQLSRLGIATDVNKFAHVHTAAMAIIADSITMDSLRMGSEVQSMVNQFIMRSQLARAADLAMSRSVAQSIIQGESLGKSTRRLVNDLRSRVGGGEFIRAGSRTFTMSEYMELVARTRTREAVTEGTLNTALNYGLDLVMWDIHDNACPKCQPYLGRVFSISGSSSVFPALEVRPPVHPNCECTIHPITDEYLEDIDYYDRLVELSNDPDTPILGRADYEEIIGRAPMRNAESAADRMRKGRKDTGR